MTRLRRFAPTAPAEWRWNGWPNAGGIAGRMSVEQVAEWRGMRTLPLTEHPQGDEIRHRQGAAHGRLAHPRQGP